MCFWYFLMSQCCSPLKTTLKNYLCFSFLSHQIRHLNGKLVYTTARFQAISQLGKIWEAVAHMPDTETTNLQLLVRRIEKRTLKTLSEPFPHKMPILSFYEAVIFGFNKCFGRFKSLEVTSSQAQDDTNASKSLRNSSELRTLLRPGSLGLWRSNPAKHLSKSPRVYISYQALAVITMNLSSKLVEEYLPDSCRHIELSWMCVSASQLFSVHQQRRCE